MAVIGRAERIRPWVALTLPPAAWYLFEVGLGVGVGTACEAVGRWLGLIWGGINLAVCLAALLIARPVARMSHDADPPARPWLAKVAMVGAAIFGLAIGLQTLATAIVPSCAR